jgi:tRNA threonylcarbamoyladenosine biosynthesis protein TsaE
MPDVWRVAAGGKAVSLEELDKVSRELLEAGKGSSVWLFFGEMGSGKTTLIKAIGKVLGVEEVMSSPTFPIVNEYDAKDGKKVYHFDLYRIRTEQEVFDIGADEYFESGEMCLVEWPEKLGGRTPARHFDIRIRTTGPEHRVIEYQMN